MSVGRNRSTVCVEVGDKAKRTGAAKLEVRNEANLNEAARLYNTPHITFKLSIRSENPWALIIASACGRGRLLYM
jgi:hypothetical protein